MMWIPWRDTVLSHCAQLIGEEEAELSAQEECVRL